MNIIKAKNYEDMSKKAADYIIAKVRTTPRINLGLATGGTPLNTYKYLMNDYQKKRTSYRQVTTFNLDEYIGLSPENPNSYHYYMKQNLFDHLNIPSIETHLPNGLAENIEEECNLYEELIDKSGGIDLQILGIGSNGHIGFNEPGTSFQSTTHIITLTPSTRKANARFFRKLEEVPSKAITMGISTIMKSKEILLLASGKSKSSALKTLLTEEISEAFPASVLKHHPHVTIIADEEALVNMKVHC